MYYIGAKKTIFTWKNYYLWNFLGLLHSLWVYYIPLMIFQDNNILKSDGKNVDIWTISLTSFTCLYAVVTGKIIIWTRWWTKVSFFFYSVMSIMVYIGYMWLSNYMPFSLVRHSVLTMHFSPLFWLTVLLCGGFSFCGDCLIEYIRITYYKSASDYVREFV